MGMGREPGGTDYVFYDVRHLSTGQHVCCIYETEDEHRALLTDYILDGLARNERVIYIVDEHTAETVLGYLRSSGIDPVPYVGSGQLVILSKTESYLTDGAFDPDLMIETLTTETKRALTDGHSGLRVTGEMTWALGGNPGSERLIEYESKLNRFLPGSKCLAICQYRRSRFDASVLLDVLRTHPIIALGSEIFDCFYYMDPESFLGPDRDAAVLDQRIAQLRRRKAMEQRLVDERRLAELYLDLLSHDINNMNQAVLSYLELLSREGGMDERRNRFVNNSLQQARGISTLIDNVRKLGGVRSGRLPIAPIDAAKELARAVEAVMNMHADRRVRVSSQVPTGGVWVQGNELLMDVFSNLLDNAVRYDGHAEVRIELHCGRVGGGGAWRFEVRDNGPGLPPGLRELMGAAYEQRSLGSSKVGLGLMLVREVVDRLGGTVSVRDGGVDGAGRGTTFIVELPSAAPETPVGTA